MNILQILGNLGADPETRFTPKGQKVTTLRVADNVRNKNADETLWWELTLWGDDFDGILPHLRKGSSIIAVGEMLPPELYTDKEGKTRYRLKMRVEFLKFPPFGRSDKAGQTQGGQAAHSIPQGTTSYNFNENNSLSTTGAFEGSHSEEEEQIPF